MDDLSWQRNLQADLEILELLLLMVEDITLKYDYKLKEQEKLLKLQKEIEKLERLPTVWLTHKLIAELFGVEVNTINYHLKEIFKSEELSTEAVIRKIRITASDGKNYPPLLKLNMKMFKVSLYL